MTIADALHAVGIWVDLPCGGIGTCGGCRIEAKGALSDLTPREAEALSNEAIGAGWRLACQAQIVGDLEIALPENAVLSGAEETAGPSLSKRRLGMALDLGSTTLVGRIIDLDNGHSLMEMSATNPQVSVGADLITRIQAGLELEGQTLLKSLAIRGINDLLNKMVNRLGIAPEQVSSMTIAGNSVMQHLLLGLSVETLSAFPFAPVSLDAVVRSAGDLGIAIDPRAEIYIFPLIGSFVGGDAAAGALALNLAALPGACLLADLGTNGEVLLSVDGEIGATSTAAGPAFEGGEIAWGMRAETGAIVDLDIRSGWQLTTIGGAIPRGIAGSGLVRIVTELLENGLLGPEGRLRRPEELTGEHARLAEGRIRQGKNGYEVILDPEREIVLTQGDIRQLQLAKGAIRSAVDSLLEEAGIKAVEISGVYLAGAFGSVLDPDSVLRIGLLPPVPIEKIAAVGNASLDGAVKVLMDEIGRLAVVELVKGIRHISLESRPDYQDAFVRALRFPT